MSFFNDPNEPDVFWKDDAFEVPRSGFKRYPENRLNIFDLAKRRRLNPQVLTDFEIAEQEATVIATREAGAMSSSLLGPVGVSVMTALSIGQLIYEANNEKNRRKAAIAAIEDARKRANLSNYKKKQIYLAVNRLSHKVAAYKKEHKKHRKNMKKYHR